jgi:hypothetical protein
MVVAWPFANRHLHRIFWLDACAEVVHGRHEAPQATCTCGIYADKSFDHLRDQGYLRRGIGGEVYLWGKVIEHQSGWRAQFAYPKTLVLSPESLLSTNPLANLDSGGDEQKLSRACYFRSHARAAGIGTNPRFDHPRTTTNTTSAQPPDSWCPPK